MAFLLWKDITKSYAGTRALRSVHMEMKRGEILCLLGPSGSGKSTLLRVTAGLEPPDLGCVILEGRDLTGVPPHRRGMGLMFQDYALFPHLDVAGNVGFGLRMLRWSRERRVQRVRETLALVRMEGFAGRRIQGLSGGEQQRVALARSLAPLPALLMLDEPLGALDAVLRGELMGELRGILKEAGATALYVTHDQEEAMSLADRVAIIRSGTIVQKGAPLELVGAPADAGVARFLSLGALVPARRAGPVYDTDIGRISPAGGKTGAQGLLLIRPSAVRISAAKGAGGITARVLSTSPRPGGTMMRISFRGASRSLYELDVIWERQMGNGTHPPSPGARIRVSVDPRETLLLEAERPL